MVVVGELRELEECVPVSLPFQNKDLQGLLQFLIDMLHLSVSLQMVGGGGCGFDSEQSVQLLHEGSNELWSLIRHDLLWKVMELLDAVEVEVGSSSSCNSVQRLAEVGSLAYSDDRHDGIIST